MGEVPETEERNDAARRRVSNDADTAFTGLPIARLVLDYSGGKRRVQPKPRVQRRRPVKLGKQWHEREGSLSAALTIAAGILAIGLITTLMDSVRIPADVIVIVFIPSCILAGATNLAALVVEFRGRTRSSARIMLNIIAWLLIAAAMVSLQDRLRATRVRPDPKSQMVVLDASFTQLGLSDCQNARLW